MVHGLVAGWAVRNRFWFLVQKPFALFGAV